ncbi:UNVERIFIED_CONTAM: Light-harvesting complex-like protein 3 isotype 2, chloroplastic [Sesamum radiatum]|uniref:Light-harvesting complex-like protein 3 isotype 2, chloroplastic n=1 Tax=Sesamum radiatum TaxID=300843 RepID=A0AAW2KDT4_SESRA
MASIGITASIQRACSSQHITKKHSNQTRPSRSLGTKQTTNVVTPNIEGLKLAEKQEKSPFLTIDNPNELRDEIHDSKNSVKTSYPRFCDERWKNGTWDLNMFVKQGRVDWDAVIVAEIISLLNTQFSALSINLQKQRGENFLNCIQKHQAMKNRCSSEALSYHGGRGLFILISRGRAAKRSNLLLNMISVLNPYSVHHKTKIFNFACYLAGRAAMVGFFMAYLVDALTGLNVVGQAGNFVCKAALFITVIGVVLFRRKEDLGNLQKLADEATYYDKQWQASWQSPDASNAVKEQIRKE